MRITIESSEREDVAPSIHTPAGLAKMETLDGGSPPEVLIQSAAQVLAIPVGDVGVQTEMDAGPPPTWLVEAIRDATPLSDQTVVGDGDGGGAPI